jgi:rSAM/selenodomain-associated transferase 1
VSEPLAEGEARGRGRALIGVLAKAPRAGLVKTRMSPPLSGHQAAELHRHLLGDVLEATAEFAGSLGLEALVVVHPEDARPEIAVSCPPAFDVVEQRGHDLAERMAWAVNEAAASGATRILLRGSDSPLLDGGTVARALEELEACDLVLCPDLAGGYCLIGLRRPAPALFDHPMSTSSVLDDTLAAASALGLRARLLEPTFGLDTVADFAYLARARSRDAEVLCPRTLAYLDENDLWRFSDWDG